MIVGGVVVLRESFRVHSPLADYHGERGFLFWRAT